MKCTLLHRIAEALRPAAESADADNVTPADSLDVEPEPEPTPEPLPQCQRRVKVSFDEVLAARGFTYPYMGRRLVAPSATERARQAVEAAIGAGR